MENKLIIKNFEIDYSFIIKNYLNPEMWKKTWNLLIYKSWSFKLNIREIDTEREKIIFRITLEDILDKSKYDNGWGYNGIEYGAVEYSLKIDNIDFLKRKINSKMKYLIGALEKQAIRATYEFKAYKKMQEKERDRLKEIAEVFLDSEGVTNEDIRDVYIDSYIDRNSKFSEYIEEYIDNKEYSELTELYLIFARITENKALIKLVENSGEDVEELMKEINEYIEHMETEEFEEEMKSNLEDI